MTYPTKDGDIGLNDCNTICVWLQNRSLLHVIRNWIKVKRI